MTTTKFTIPPLVPILCVYHADCADGLGAAWAVYKALGSEVEFIAAKYGEPWPWYDAREVDRGHHKFLSGRDLIIVDFSFTLEVLKAMAREARSVLVLDHHKTAQQDLETLSTAIHWNSKADLDAWFSVDREDNLAAIFDMNRSGAGLAWDYLHPTSTHIHPDRGPVITPVRNIRPRIIDLIEDRDLWKFRFGDETRAFHAVLASYDWSDLPTMFNYLDDWHHLEQEDSHIGMNRLASEIRASQWRIEWDAAP